MYQNKGTCPPIEGLITTTITLPAEIHEAMRDLRRARRAVERGDVRLSRLYREAVEAYLNLKPQRDLLRAYREAQAAPDPETYQEAEHAHADAL